MKQSYEKEIQKLLQTYGLDAVKSAVETLCTENQTLQPYMEQVSGNK